MPAGRLLAARTSGLFTDATRTQYFTFSAPAIGWAVLSLGPATPWYGAAYGAVPVGNLGIKLQLLKDSSVIASSNTSGGLSASVTFKLAATGDYVVAVTALGSPAWGFTDYASIGKYTLDISWPALGSKPTAKPPTTTNPAPVPSPSPVVGPGTGASSTLQPRVVIIPGITLCGAGAAWYGWLRDQLNGRAPTYTSVFFKCVCWALGCRLLPLTAARLCNASSAHFGASTAKPPPLLTLGPLQAHA